ncbi:uncharacterized protein BDR25DRAFT_347737 [Lindgomyces ingoldianus]|uniref:Uncharacterized protein n=1 Tax=Lindgomyces ingoldianus TaxID=673940 RepID=A0ACB6RE23_9PLEO|nr:uncharacterized protein BDR25DRAFT_347737 [Lindgomyces ingoldianus]KAF2477362.1 hypothetical protein BDR25DRAFT_347737 [Lindgomyces ingoldianus]
MDAAKRWRLHSLLRMQRPCHLQDVFFIFISICCCAPTFNFHCRSLSLQERPALAFPFPSTSAKPSNKSVLVWGSSSSVGASAIQLAAGASGTFISIASIHNIDKVKELGAKHVFEYKSSAVADDIISALRGTEFLGVCDCVGTPDAVRYWALVYQKLGGRYAFVMPEVTGLPDGVQGTSVFAPNMALADKATLIVLLLAYISEAVWATYIPEALANGTFKAKPDPILTIV